MREENKRLAEENERLRAILQSIYDNVGYVSDIAWSGIVKALEGGEE